MRRADDWKDQYTHHGHKPLTKEKRDSKQVPDGSEYGLMNIRQTHYQLTASRSKRAKQTKRRAVQHNLIF